jgi:hypothetical protein
MRIHPLIRQLSIRTASGDQDKVYALFGLKRHRLDGNIQSHHLTIQPHYSFLVVEVIEYPTPAVIDETSCIDVLSDSGSKLRNKLLSWDGYRCSLCLFWPSSSWEYDSVQCNELLVTMDRHERLELKDNNDQLNVRLIRPGEIFVPTRNMDIVDCVGRQRIPKVTSLMFSIRGL